MRADGPLRERGIGVGLADERPAHAASPAVPVTMQILTFILATDALTAGCYMKGIVRILLRAPAK
jgi:hypothetical protein